MGGTLKRLIDPIGIGIGKGSPGSFLDPLNVFGKASTAQADAISSAPVPTPSNPVSAANAGVVQAEHDFNQRNMLKKSMRKTIIAGDTGGYSPSSPLGAGGAAQGYKAKLG